MDNKDTINDLKLIVKQFCEDRDWDQFHTPKELAIGISTEANELLQLFRFKSDSDMKKMFLSNGYKNIVDELADVFYFVLRFAQLYNIDLSMALKDKIVSNSEKYPINKSKGNNIKYNEY